MHEQRHARLPAIADACADEGELLAMSVGRFIAAGYMTADVACWDAAYDCAERVLGPEHGCRLVATMAGVMRALRSERARDWSFMPANCCRLTPDEGELLTALALARRGDRRSLRDEARRLAGIEAPRLSAALALAGALVEELRPLLASFGPKAGASRTRH